jgi:hypothetical protein
MSSGRNYPLFTLSKLLTVKSQNQKPSASIDKASGKATPKDEPISIKIVAVGGYIGNAFVALYCSNGKITKNLLSSK